LVRNEIEASEDLLLCLEIIIQSLFASFDFTVECVQQLFTAISGASGNDCRLFSSLAHQVFPFVVHLFESFGVFWELGTDIIGADEDGFKTLPVPLHFSPDGDDIVNSLKSLLPFGAKLFEFFNFLLGHHGHNSHLLGFDKFDNSVHRAEEVSVFVLEELEVLVVPSLGDSIQRRLNLAFFLGALDDFVYLIGVFEQLQPDQVLKAELGVVILDLLAGSSLELLPVAALHELGVEHSNQGNDFAHVGHTLLKVHKALPLADDFVLGSS